MAVFSLKKSGFSRPENPAALAALEDDGEFRAVHFEDGHAGDGAAGIVAGVGVDDVVRADDDGDIGGGEIGIDLLEFVELRVGDIGLGEEDVHVAGHAAGDGMDGVFDGDAALLEASAKLANDVLGLGGGHAVAGDEDDLPGVGKLGGGVLDADLAHFAPGGVRAGRLLVTLPKAPKRTLVIERFIALHMRIERMKPEKPSRVPAMMRTLFPRAKPVAAEARPA
jgi:hypothetical protein